ncbi:MAG: hypothetical protein KA479_10430 [Saprospiraceae bacterium]|nr:hypothetical protein [Saprospiraceae bacterium]
MALTALISFNACQNKASDAPFARYSEHLTGEWQLVTAYRNEQETRVLDGTFFNFSAGQAMETNLPLGGPLSAGNLKASYKLLSDSLVMNPGSLPTQTFHISVLDSQYLIMTTMIQNQAFRFDLERK